MFAACRGVSNCIGQSSAVARTLGQHRNTGGTWIFCDMVNAVGDVDVELVARIDDAARAQAAAAKLGHTEHATHAATLCDGGDRTGHQFGFGRR